MPPAKTLIQLDTTTNQWRFAKGSKEQRSWRRFGHGKGHRYEAAILLCLAELPAGDTLSLSTLQALVRDKGQAKNLNHAQLSRLYDSINLTGNVAGQVCSKNSESWAWRIVGAKTTGAWCLQLKNGVQISTIHLPALPHRHFSPIGLTAELFDCGEMVRLLKAIFSIDLVLNDGDTVSALVQCQTLLQAGFSSLAARLLVQLRTVHILFQLRRFADAKALLAECSQTTACPMLDYLYKEVHSVMRARLRYDSDGSTLTPSELQHHITELNTKNPHPLFGFMEAERQNLLGLLHYRQAEKCSDLGQRQLLKRTAIHHFHGALLLALATNNYQWIQRFTYNLSLAAPNPIPLLDYAHDVGEKMRVGSNSQWILLSLCKEMYRRLQQSKPTTNTAIEAIIAKMRMPKTTLPAFWLELVKRTQATANPREIGNAYFLAQWGLEQIHATGESRKMQAALDALHKEYADLARVLKADFKDCK